MKTKRHHIPYIDIISGLLILRVICLHSLTNFTVVGCSDFSPVLQHSTLYRFADTLFRYSISGFVFLSGIKFGLRYDSMNLQEYGRYFVKRSHRILRPYLLFTAGYMLLGLTLSLADPYCSVNLTSFAARQEGALIWKLLGPENPGYQLWFLVMLYLVNVIYPFFRKIVSSHMIRLCLGLLLFASYTWFDLPYPLSYMRFIFVYDLGVLLAGLLTERSALQVRKPAVIACGLTVLAMAVRSFCGFLPIIPWFEMILELSLPFAFVLTCQACHCHSKPKIIRYFGQNAWPVYLVHEPFILYNLGRFFYLYLDMNSPVVVPLLALSTILFSLAGAILLQKTPVIKRIL